MSNLRQWRQGAGVRDFYVFDDEDNIVARCGSAALAAQIVREHNAGLSPVIVNLAEQRRNRQKERNHGMRED